MAIVLAASACHKGRETFGIVETVDPEFTIRVTGINPRVAVREDQRITVQSNIGTRCAAEMEYPAAGNHAPSRTTKSDVGPEIAKGLGVGIAELTWQVREGTAPQVVRVIVTCYRGPNFNIASLPAEISFEVIPGGTQ